MKRRNEASSASAVLAVDQPSTTETGRRFLVALDRSSREEASDDFPMLGGSSAPMVQVDQAFARWKVYRGKRAVIVGLLVHLRRVGVDGSDRCIRAWV